MGEIHKKLQKIQHQLKVPKSRWNKFGKFWYRSLEDIYEAVKPLLDEQGLILTVHDEIIMMGNRFYIKATNSKGETYTWQDAFRARLNPWRKMA